MGSLLADYFPILVFLAIAGIIGDGPSHYSKSPALWNAAFGRLGMNAIYLPFDVDHARVGVLLRTLRNSQCFMGINVTVPYKVRVIDFLDELDGGAARIGVHQDVGHGGTIAPRVSFQA